eukprot:759860_1
MTTGNTKLNRQQKIHIVRNFIPSELLIPNDIINLCTLFYDDVMYWQVSTNHLKQFFYKTPTGSGVVGPSFKYNRTIAYQLVIYPNGSQKLYNGDTE